MKIYVVVENGTPLMLTEDRDIAIKTLALGVLAGQSMNLSVVTGFITKAADGEAIDEAFEEARVLDSELVDNALAQVREQVDKQDPLELKVVH